MTKKKAKVSEVDLDKINEALDEPQLDEKDKSGDKDKDMDKEKEKDKDEDKSKEKNKSYSIKKESLDEFKNLVEQNKEFPQEFVVKMVEMFEACVNQAIKDVQKDINESNKAEQDVLEEALVEDIAEKVDVFAEQVVNEWIEENKAVLESSIKVEKATKVLEGLKQLFAENSLEVVEGQEDVVKASEEEIKTLKEQLNTQISKNLQLQEAITNTERKDILAEETSDCSANEVEKISGLIENMKIKDNDDYRSKVKNLIETVCKKEQHPITEAIFDIVKDKDENKKVSSLEESVEQFKQSLLGNK